MEHGPTASEAVITAVARRMGVDPLDMETPLYDAIDPDELNALLGGAGRTGRSPVEVTFQYYEYTVTVDSNGSVTLTE
ncbi:HalOD1 output domain-containing protein [Haloarcula saliterrae]|nr:HalOD1 output domain-containing protein [Haloarcula sp. S1CR25-12]